MTTCRNKNHRGPDLEGDCDCQDVKHTPGPWVLEVQKDGGVWTYNIRTETPHNPAGTIGKHVATLNPYLGTLENDYVLGNGSLIAAAPDLLAALKLMREEGDVLADEAADAAIAKAEGRT